ncbi:hypothetical protein SAURM35S_00390 [Streptomyces aurantiogriseus]
MAEEWVRNGMKDRHVNGDIFGIGDTTWTTARRSA